MAVYGYMRVSTDEQDTAMQLTAMKKRVCDEIFEDHGICGDQMKRPGLDALLAKVQSGDSLVVWKLDRLGRRGGEVIVMINDLTNRGIGFVSLTEGFDTTTPAGRAMAGILAVFAQLEREIITERIRAGVGEYIRKNKRWGRANRVVKNHAEQVSDLLKEGKSQNEIAKILGFSQAAVSKFLSSTRMAQNP